MLTCLKNRDCLKQKALQQGDILKHFMVHGAQHDDIEIELFCFTFIERTVLQCEYSGMEG